MFTFCSQFPKVLWVLAIERGSYVRAASVLNYWPISLSPKDNFLKKEKRNNN